MRHARSLRYLLCPEELPCSQGCIFGSCCATDKEAIVGLLASHGGTGEAIAASEPA